VCPSPYSPTTIAILLSVDPLTPLAEGVCRKSVNAEEDMNVA